MPGHYQCGPDLPQVRELLIGFAKQAIFDPCIHSYKTRIMDS